MFAGQMQPRAVTWACIAITGMAAGCMLGVYSGIYVSQHKLLTPKEVRTTASSTYLRDFSVDQVDMIEQLRVRRVLSIEEAYQQLLELSRPKRVSPPP